MSVLTLYVDEVMRTLSNDGQYPFVVNDKTVDIVRFALNTGFADVVLDEQTALRVMYQRPGETEVRAKTLAYHDTDGLHNYYDWQLLSADLAEKGTLMVALCILRTDGDVEEWHTTPCQIRVLDTIHTDDSDEGDETITPTVAQRVAVLETMIQRVASGAPVVVSSVAEMTDTAQIYVLTTDGYWYYHDGSAWTAGGEYGAVATDRTLTQAGIPADAETVGNAIESVEHTIDSITGNTFSASLHLTADADNTESRNRHFFKEIPIESGKTYQLDFTFNECHFSGRDAGSRVFQVATATQASYNYLVDIIARFEESYSPATDGTSFTFTATANTSHLYVYCHTSFNSAVDIEINIKGVRTFAEVDAVRDDIGSSVFGLPIAFEFDPTYSYSATARSIGTYTLTAGTYVFSYRQVEDAKPTSRNSRCTPWYKTPGGVNVFKNSTASGIEREPGLKYWVIDIDTDGDYAFYFWYRYAALTDGGQTAHITDIRLYKTDTVRGAIQADIAQDDTLEEIPYSYVSMYQRIGCIGDSWTAGSIYQTENTWAGTLNNLSWCKNAERLTGSQFIQYARGGLSARTWLTDIHGKVALENTEPCPLYIVNLGINDATEITEGTITLGQVDDFENEVTGTFFYYYGAVIDCVKNHAPNAKIILETILMRSEQQVNVANAIIEYASHYNIPYVDMYSDAFYRSSSVILVGGHPTAATHAGMALANLRLFAKCIKDNPDYFKINTQSEFGDFSLIGIADSIGRNYISSPTVYRRDAGATHSANTYEIARAYLPAGKYIFKWTQTAATKTSSNSRCTPIYCFVGDDTNRYYSASSNFPNTSAGTYRWVFELTDAQTILMYFWSKELAEDFTARDFDLYAYDSVRGRMQEISDAVDGIGNLSDLTTEDKSSLVSAINEINEHGGDGGGGSVTVDSELSTTSKHPVQNKVITVALAGKADKATALAGYGITDVYTKTESDGKYLTSHQDISGKQDKINLVTSLSSSSTDTQYPSAKCVYDALGDIETLLAAL